MQLAFGEAFHRDNHLTRCLPSGKLNLPGRLLASQVSLFISHMYVYTVIHPQLRSIDVNKYTATL